MSRPSPTDLELLRLARLLKVDPSRLQDLSKMAPEDLKALRSQVAGRLFDQGQEAFRRAASVAGLVPAGLAAKLAQHALGPVLAARTTAVTDPEKAVELSTRFPASFLADVAVEMDPRAVDDLVRALPAPVIATVGDELAARGEWLVMADFVGSINTDALRATMHALSEESILRVARLLEDPSRLDEIVSLLPDDRLAALVVKAREQGLTDELDAIVANLGELQRSRLPM